ncbi:hypothetical protein ACFSTC_04995 [Nonomuraea ferruginea]
MPSPRDRQARFATFAVYAVQGLSFATLLTQVAHLQDKHGLSTGALTALLLIVPVFAGGGQRGGGRVRRPPGQLSSCCAWPSPRSRWPSCSPAWLPA